MKVPSRAAATSWQRIDGEMVLLHVDRGELVGLNRVGGRAWELIDGARSVDEIVRVISSEFRADEARVARDVTAFVDALAGARLIEVREV